MITGRGRRYAKKRRFEDTQFADRSLKTEEKFSNAQGGNPTDMANHSGSMNILLMGDDIFDDFDERGTVNSTAIDVAEALTRRLDLGKEKVTVRSCAVGKSIVANVKGSIWPDSKHTEARRAAKLRTYPIDPKDGRVYPMRELKKGGVTHVVLSVGWNDVKISFATSLEPAAVIRTIKEADMIRDLESLVASVLDVVPRLVIVFMPLPHAIRMHQMYRLPGAEEMGSIIADVGKFYMRVARKFKIPVVDLSRSINPYDRSLYAPDRPDKLSTKGRTIVAGLIAHVISKYDFDTTNEISRCKVFSGNLSSKLREDLNDKDFGRKTHETRLKHYVFECKTTAKSACALS